MAEPVDDVDAGSLDLCDVCMRSGVEVHQTTYTGKTICVECAEDYDFDADLDDDENE